MAPSSPPTSRGAPSDVTGSRHLVKGGRFWERGPWSLVCTAKLQAASLKRFAGSNLFRPATYPSESVLLIRLRPDFSVVFEGYAGGAEHLSQCQEASNRSLRADEFGSGIELLERAEFGHAGTLSSTLTRLKRSSFDKPLMSPVPAPSHSQKDGNWFRYYISRQLGTSCWSLRSPLPRPRIRLPPRISLTGRDARPLTIWNIVGSSSKLDR